MFFLPETRASYPNNLMVHLLDPELKRQTLELYSKFHSVGAKDVAQYDEQDICIMPLNLQRDL